MSQKRPLSEPPPSIVVDLPVPTARPLRRGRAGFWRLFYVVRVGLLLGVLTLVLLWGVTDHAERQARLDWERPLEVALILIEQSKLDAATVDAFRKSIPLLEQQLGKEFAKYRSGIGVPVRFYVYGPVVGPIPPPPSESEAIFDRLVESVARRVYAHQVDRLAGAPLFGYDSRIYVAARPPTSNVKQFVEGFSEQGGRLGFVDVELDPSMVEFALFVAVHELFHTLGATDKYDRDGNSVSAGFVNPAQQPLFPQLQAEVMAHGRPVAPGIDEPPTFLRELGVGIQTARELRWGL